MMATETSVPNLSEVTPQNVPGWMKVMGLVWPFALVVFIIWVIFYASGNKAAAGSAMAESEIWWSQQTGVWIGVIAGVGGGVIGGIFGPLGGIAGSLSAAGKSRGTAMGLMNITIVAFTFGALVGVIALAAGIIARVQGQPYHVHYPLILVGGILTLVLGMLAPSMAWMKTNVIARRYEMHELRKMQSQDAG